MDVREILFKAKRTDNGEWAEGSLLRLKSTDSEDGYRHYIIPPMTNGSWSRKNFALKFISPCMEVDARTVCQYTGLKDRNNEKIFEGDRVEIAREDEIFTVEWNPQTATIEMSTDTICVSFDNYYSYEVEVVGNIYNNETGKD